MDSFDQRQLAGYLDALSKRQRVVGVVRDQQILGWVSYFLLDTMEEVRQFHERSLWSVPLDSPTGVLCYIDKMVSLSGWTRMLRRTVETVIRAQHPEIHTAVWFRASEGPDRMILRPLGACHAEVR